MTGSSGIPDAAAGQMRRRRLVFSLMLGADAFLLDRIHKYLQIEHWGWTGGEFVHVTGFFDYILVWNPGVSYGLLTGLPAPALLAVMAAAMALLAVWWWRSDSVLTKAGLAIILGGALSHVVDRAIYGAVPDFFHFHWGDWSFYIFNVADIAITLGVLLLLADMLRPAAAKQI